MIPATIEVPGVAVPIKHKPAHSLRADDSVSTGTDSEAGGSTSAGNSDVEAGSRWKSNRIAGLTRRGTVQVVGGPEERLCPVDSQDSFATLGTVADPPMDAMGPGHIFDCGGSGECAAAPQRRW